MESSNIEERIRSLESRISALESGGQNRTRPTPPPGRPSVATGQLLERKQNLIIPNPPLRTDTRPGNWLGIIAVVCFVLAAGFIIKLSIDSGWLTPERQIGLALIFGLSLIGAGLRLVSTDREYASYLPGAGIIVLYLATFAAHRFYSIISLEIALTITSAVSLLCVWLYQEIRHDIYALTASVGSYAGPVILGLNTTTIFSIYYFLLCSAAFSLISIQVRSRTLTIISAYLAILMTALIGFRLEQNELIASVLGLHFLVFALGTYLFTKLTKEPLAESDPWGFFPVLLLFYAMEYVFIDRSHPGLAPWISLLFAALLLCLYLSAKKWFPDRNLASQSMILAFISIVCFHSAYLKLLPDDARPWLFVVILLGATFFPIGKLARVGGSPYWAPFLAILAILALEYISMASHLIFGSDSLWLGVSLASFASIWILLCFGDGTISKQAGYGGSLLSAAHLLAILSFYRLATDHGSLAVSASWLLYAVVVVGVAFLRKDEIMAKSALLVLGLAAGKALLYDASAAPTLIRIFCLILTGVVLYGSGLLLRKASQWSS